MASEQGIDETSRNLRAPTYTNLKGLLDGKNVFARLDSIAAQKTGYFASGHNSYHALFLSPGSSTNKRTRCAKLLVERVDERMCRLI